MDNAGRISEGDAASWHVRCYDSTRADYRLLSDRDTREDAGPEPDPSSTANADGSRSGAGAAFLTEAVAVHNDDSPGNQGVVADCHFSVTHDHRRIKPRVRPNLDAPSRAHIKCRAVAQRGVWSNP